MTPMALFAAWLALSVGIVAGVWLGHHGRIAQPHPGRLFRHKSTGEMVWLKIIARMAGDFVVVYASKENDLIAAKSDAFFESFEDVHSGW